MWSEVPFRQFAINQSDIHIQSRIANNVKLLSLIDRESGFDLKLMIFFTTSSVVDERQIEYSDWVYVYKQTKIGKEDFNMQISS